MAVSQAMEQPSTAERLAGSVDLQEFLDGAGDLTLEQRRLIVDQALILLEGTYVHLPLKAAMHAVDPVQRIRLLRTRLERRRLEASSRSPVGCCSATFSPTRSGWLSPTWQPTAPYASCG